MKAIAVAVLLGLFAENAPPQTEPHAPGKTVSEKDLDEHQTVGDLNSRSTYPHGLFR